MKLLKILLGIVVVIAVLLGALAVFIAMQPADFRVARSATVNAPSPLVFAQINNLHNWQEWSPWAKLDPLCKVTFAGPVDGKDASFSWSGNEQVGEGTMTIIESVPDKRVKFRLDFVKPFAGTNEADFKLEPEGTGTRVTWTMSGERNFLMKGIGLFVDCDSMMGPVFEKGLAQLKALSEKIPRAPVP